MPRIRQNTEQYLRQDFLKSVRIGRGREDLLKTKDLSDAAGIPYGTLRRRLVEPEDLTVNEMRGLIRAVQLAPEHLLAFFGYSGAEIKNMTREERV